MRVEPEALRERDRLGRSLRHREEPEVRDHLQLAPVRDMPETASLLADRSEDRVAAVERVVGAGGEDDELGLLGRLARAEHRCVDEGDAFLAR